MMGIRCQEIYKIIAVNEETRIILCQQVAGVHDWLMNRHDGIELHHWHGIHFLLTGSPLDDTLPLGFLLNDHQHIEHDNRDETIVYYTNMQMCDIVNALQGVSDDAFHSRFDPEQFLQQSIYPTIGASITQQQEYLSALIQEFQTMKTFITERVSEGNEMIVYNYLKFSEEYQRVKE